MYSPLMPVLVFGAACKQAAPEVSRLLTSCDRGYASHHLRLRPWSMWARHQHHLHGDGACTRHYSSSEVCLPGATLCGCASLSNGWWHSAAGTSSTQRAQPCRHHS